MSLSNLIKKLTIVFLVIFFSLSITSTYSIDITLDSEEEALFNLINEYRQNNGISPLTFSSNLTIAAKLHSQDMASNNYFSHYSLDGRSPSDRVRNAGYFYIPIGENIAAGYINAIDVFNAWKNSPEHNKNMLNKDFKSIGIGRAYNSSSFYKWYWTADFGGNISTGGSTTSATTITYTLIIYYISYISSYTTIKTTITETIINYITLNLTSSIITTKTINQTNIFSSTFFKTSIIPKTTIINLTNIESSTTTMLKTNTITISTTTSFTSIITKTEKIIEMPIAQFSIISILIIISILTLISLKKK